MGGIPPQKVEHFGTLWNIGEGTRFMKGDRRLIRGDAEGPGVWIARPNLAAIGEEVGSPLDGQGRVAGAGVAPALQKDIAGEGVGAGGDEI